MTSSCARTAARSRGMFSSANISKAAASFSRSALQWTSRGNREDQSHDEGALADTFAKIRENFQVMFAELFGGGRANLMLIDESDPLESGIEIIAKPPGKQFKAFPFSPAVNYHDGGLPSIRHLHGEAQPVLRAGRNGCPARRIEYQPLYQDPGPFRRPEPIRRHYLRVFLRFIASREKLAQAHK